MVWSSNDQALLQLLLRTLGSLQGANPHCRVAEEQAHVLEEPRGWQYSFVLEFELMGLLAPLLRVQRTLLLQSSLNSQALKLSRMGVTESELSGLSEALADGAESMQLEHDGGGGSGGGRRAAECDQMLRGALRLLLSWRESEVECAHLRSWQALPMSSSGGDTPRSAQLGEEAAYSITELVADAFRLSAPCMGVNCPPHANSVAGRGDQPCAHGGHASFHAPLTRVLASFAHVKCSSAPFTSCDAPTEAQLRASESFELGRALFAGSSSSWSIGQLFGIDDESQFDFHQPAATRALMLFLADTPLRVGVFSAQIAQGLWVRNGSLTMEHQVYI